jgi:hypothetical protein
MQTICDDLNDQIDRGIKLWDKVLLCCSKHSLTSYWVDGEIGKAFQKEQVSMKERGQKVLALIPLNLDGFLFDGWQDGKAPRVRARFAPDFLGWDADHAKCEGLIEQVVHPGVQNPDQRGCHQLCRCARDAKRTDQIALAKAA